MSEHSPNPLLMSSAIAILSPLVEQAARHGFDEQETETRLLALVGSLKRTGERARDILGLEEDDPDNNLLLASLAPFVAEHGDDMVPEGIAQVLDCAASFLDQLPEVSDLPEPVSQSLGSGIKKALFGPTADLCRAFDALGMAFEHSRTQMRLIIETAIHLSAVLAFQWAKKSGIDDGREALFIDALGPVLALTEQAWAESATTELTHYDWQPGGAASRQYPQLSEEVNEFDMGWAAALGGTPELLSQIALRLECRILWLTPNQWPKSIRGRLAGALAAALDARAAEAWKVACHRLSEEVSAMDEDTLSDFLSGEGAEPMRITRFEAAMEGLDQEPLLDNLEAEPDDMIRLARKRLAVLWGVSDAACQTQWL